MSAVALGTRSIRRRQPLRDGLASRYHGEELRPEPAVRPASSAQKPSLSISRISDADEGQYPHGQLDGQLIDGMDIDNAAPIAHNGTGSGSNPPSNNHGERDEATGKVQLSRHISVRSEICVSPTWSRNEEKRKRKKELKQLAREQRELEKKLKRETMGKSREPRRLTKAPPGHNSSRASSAHSAFRRFSTASSIRSFWSNRSSRASSIQDPEEWGRDKPSRNSISSQADGTTRKYKFLGIWPRRAGAGDYRRHGLGPDESSLQTDAPTRTLHTTRKNADLRSSARALEQRNLLVEPSRERRPTSLTADEDLGRNPAIDGQQHRKRRIQYPTKHGPESSAVSNREEDVTKAAKEVPSPGQNTNSDEHQRPKKATMASRSPMSSTTALRRSPIASSDPDDREIDKPGDFREPSLSRNSPLEVLLADAASIIAEAGLSRDEEATDLKESHTSATKPSSEKSFTRAAIPDVAMKDESSNKSAAETPSDAPENPAEVSQNEIKYDSAEPVVELASETVSPAPAETSSSRMDKEKGQEPPRRPVKPHSRDSSFQSSPLAGPPLVVQDADVTVETEVLEGVGKENRVDSRRPAKLRRRSASATRDGVSISSQVNHFPRFWKAGQKEKKVKGNDATGLKVKQNNESDESQSSIRQGKQPVHVVNHSNGNHDSPITSQQNDGTEEGIGEVKNGPTPALPSLPRRSTAPEGSIQINSRRNTPDNVQPQPRIGIDTTGNGKRRFSIDANSKDILGSTSARTSTGTLTLRDLMNDATIVTGKGTYQPRPENDRHHSSSSVLTTGSQGQRSQRTAFHPGQRVAKMFVICCHCKFWHDMPSEAYSNLALPPQTRDCGTSGQVKHEKNGDTSDKSAASASKQPSPSSEKSLDVTPVEANSNHSAPRPKDESKSTTRPSSSRSGLILQTSNSCCWCSHRMSRSCCAGWTAIVNLHERHH